MIDEQDTHLWSGRTHAMIDEQDTHLWTGRAHAMITKLKLSIAGRRKSVMNKSLFAILLFASASLAQGLPDYYPKGGLLQTGVIDAVYLDESRIVINDIPLQMNARPIVRSPSSAYDSM